MAFAHCLNVVLFLIENNWSTWQMISEPHVACAVTLGCFIIKD